MLRAAKIFQNKMILQRDTKVTIWGTGDLGQSVTVQIQGKEGSAAVDDNGSWKVILPKLKASFDEQMVICSGEETLTFIEVAVGEVWVAGGQSNMEFWMRYEKHKNEALQTCPNDTLRFFDVPEVCYEGQLEEFDYSRQNIWRKATAEDLEYFCSVGFYFQKDIQEALHVPVGIIGCNWGGTTACAWMNPENVKKAGPQWIKDYEEQISKMDMEQFWKNQHNNPLNDKGNPFSDPFGEFILPKTPSEEEIKEFFKGMEDHLDDFLEILQPQSIPGSLYEHMVKTIAPYSIKGFLWYQGESDDAPGKNVLYKDMLCGLINDWRELWENDNLPFLIVQLPGFESWMMGDIKNEYPIIRKCQEEAADAMENVYLCSISDAGEEKDIHPKNKMVVGTRLALLARGHVYGEAVLCDPPRVREAVKQDNRIVISFDNAEGGLKLEGETVDALKIYAGGKELHYKISVDEAKFILDMEQTLNEKISIQFARTPWFLVNLYNQSQIPAIPFEFEVS